MPCGAQDLATVHGACTWAGVVAKAAQPRPVGAAFPRRVSVFRDKNSAGPIPLGGGLWLGFMPVQDPLNSFPPAGSDDRGCNSVLFQLKLSSVMCQEEISVQGNEQKQQIWSR